jgi:hypothetical protein
MAAYKLIDGGVVRNGATHIPEDAENRDWREYQEWVALGNIPDPADPPPTPPIEPLNAEELYDMLVLKGTVSDIDRPRPKP